MLARSIFVMAAAVTVAAAPQARAQISAEAFFKGKDIQVLYGAGPGGTYGLYTQLAVRHMRKYIPGQPNLIMQSMPGAGGLVALNYSFNVAPKDGSLMHLLHGEVLYETLLNKDAKFNASGYQYIGRIADGDGLVLVTRTSGLRSLEDARKREVTLGVTGFTNSFALAPLMLNRTTNTRFRIIAGYKGASEILVAMQRGELDGAGMTVANAVTLHGDKLTSGEMIPHFAIASKRLPDYPEVPVMTEFGNAGDKTLMEIYASTGTIGRALAYPPGVPADRVAALREAFARMLEDPDFRAETKKSNTPVTPMTGVDLAAYVTGVVASPASQVEAARKLHQELLAGHK